MVESLIYLIISSCSDIEYSVVRLAQQIANPSNKYYQAELYLCRYLLNTCKYQIVYNRLNNESVITHSDLDWAQDSESHKSVTSYFTLMAHEVTF